MSLAASFFLLNNISRKQIKPVQYVYIPQEVISWYHILYAKFNLNTFWEFICTKSS